MIKHSDQRVGVFVDVQNLYYSAKNIYNSKVNFGEILNTAIAGRKLIRAFAYVVRAEAPEEQSFFDALSKQGFELRMKDLQIFFGGQKKGDWDVGITIDAIRLSDKLDVVVLVSGDGDYIPLVEYLKFSGQQVEVIAYQKSSSSKLIEAADDFIDLCLDENKYLIRGSKKAFNLKRLVNPIQRVTRPRRRTDKIQKPNIT
ncbi:NYN domain-containing protein [Patescibacteria group bacterium]|nr:NYN domain-containing protein [Patescibacteria group bacterium]MBU1889867.1 NYN domain-containing protein [Patescibacteria group bacterium]